MQMCTNHQKRKHYSEEQALRWMIQVAKGLKYLHSTKPQVIWRDAKLENILMRRKFCTVVTPILDSEELFGKGS